VVATAHHDLSGIGNGFTGLVDAPFAAIDDPGENERLCLGATFREPAVDEQLIGATLCRQRG
jgi:hypothetical protein